MPENNPYDTPAFQQALLQVISKNTFDLIAVAKKDDYTIVYVNEMGVKLFEYEKASQLINAIAPFKRKKNLTTAEHKDLEDEISLEAYLSQEAEYVTKNGKPFWGRLQSNPFSADGINYLLIQIEKNDRAKWAEEKLLKEEQRFGALLDYASIGVAIVDQQQEILLMNPFALRLFGYKIEELAGKKIETLIPLRFHEKHQMHHQNYYDKPQNRPMGLGMDLFAIKKDGTEFPVEVSLGTYKTDKETFVIAFINDITIRKKGEDEIRKLNADLEAKVKERTDELAVTISKLEEQIKETDEVELELRKSLEKEKELGELKSRFVSMASHEFRTPLSTVLSSTYLLQKYTSTEDQPKRDKHIERIVSSVNMLTDILNDFLSVGKIEEGQITPKFCYFNISEHISNLVNEMKPILKKGQEIIYCHNGEDKTWLDPSLLKHIVMNLLSNAIKFSPEGADITIETNREDAGLTLRVKDQGIGISKEDQQHLFQRFFRGTNVTTIQGTGLGLHIVQKYADLMDGETTFNSELEKGTAFMLRFEMKD